MSNKTIPEPKDRFDLPTNYRNLEWQERRAVREQYAEEQNNECFWCGSDLNGEVDVDLLDIPVDWSLFPGGEEFLKYPVHLQHDHSTNMTEGAVHSLCNAIMWNYFRR